MTYTNIWIKPATPQASRDLIEQDPSTGKWYYVTPAFPFTHHFASETPADLGVALLDCMFTHNMDADAMVANMSPDVRKLLEL